MRLPPCVTAIPVEGDALHHLVIESLRRGGIGKGGRSRPLDQRLGVAALSERAPRE